MVGKTFSRALFVGRDEGVTTLCKRTPPYLYQQIWPYLPEEDNVVLNGVAVGESRKVTDGYLPDSLTRYVPEDDQTYEQQYVSCIRSHVREGDRVVVVGGGEGVSTVVAAMQVGEGGDVQTYEGGAAEAEKTRETAELNDVTERVTVHHAIVSNDYSLRSSAVDAPILPTDELPACDTLTIDADGAELPILKEMRISPETIIVEHHAVRNDGEEVLPYQPEEVRRIITQSGYEIVEEVADPRGTYKTSEERIIVAEKA